MDKLSRDHRVAVRDLKSKISASKGSKSPMRSPMTTPDKKKFVVSASANLEKQINEQEIKVADLS
jgi:hypothetical protein